MRDEALAKFFDKPEELAWKPTTGGVNNVVNYVEVSACDWEGDMHAGGCRGSREGGDGGGKGCGSEWWGCCVLELFLSPASSFVPWCTRIITH